MKTDFSYLIIKKIIISFFLLILPFCMVGCAEQSPISGSDFYFDTVISITIYDSDSEKLLKDCFDMASKYEQMLSKTIEGSDIWEINHAKGAKVSIHPETFELLTRALTFSELTCGKLDLTIGSVSELWNFSSDNDTHIVPDQEQIENLLSHVDYHTLKLEEDNGKQYAYLTDPYAQIDLGFIAKGYIADQMKEYLKRESVNSAIINLGGNVLTVGSKPDGTNFKIGIRKPFGDTSAPIEVLSVSDKSVVTSGIYERYFYQNNRLYHHILDTHTGYPISNHLYSVTIISDSSMDGDALSTACLILGLEKGLQLIENTPNCEALFITDDYEIISSSGLSL